jgi:hypothetical protein
VDAGGNLFVTGSSVGVNGFHDLTTIAYSSSGVPLWTNRYDGPANGNDFANAITVDGNGNVIVVGASASTNVDPFDADCVTIKYTGAGVPLWTNRHGGAAHGNDGMEAVAVDNAGRVFVVGFEASESSRHCVTIAYSNDGMPLWTNRVEGYYSAIAVDTIGDTFIAGYRGNSDGYSDFVTLKYASGRRVPVALRLQQLGAGIILDWTNPAFILQAAPTMIGKFTNIPNARSPYTNPITCGQQFFRLISD